MTHAPWKSHPQNFMVRVVVYSLCQHWSMLVKMTVTPKCTFVQPQNLHFGLKKQEQEFPPDTNGIWIRGDPVAEHSFFMIPFCRLPKTCLVSASFSKMS